MMQSSFLVVIIYIPLCLYFNAEGGTQESFPNAFTFHYVSILIRTAG